ncbi:MAG: histidinol dehydrogenase [Bdellovibrionota bacterium]
MKIIRQGTAAFEKELSRLASRQVLISGQVRSSVEKILSDVARRGDAAVFDYTRRFDGVRLTPKSLVVPAADLRKAYRKIDPVLRRSLETAARRIRAYHEKQRRSSWWFSDREGANLGLRFSPLDAVCLYVPGGKASYPSTLLMTSIPAKVAGVKDIYVASPGASLDSNPVLLAAAYVAGVTRVFRVGGAQAVGAFAYGTKSIPAVNKIVGPGNAYVAEAKRQVFGRVGIDQLAGPSEIVVVADRFADPTETAWDLLSQAEHDELATSVLFTDDAELAASVSTRVLALARLSPRWKILQKSLEQFGRIFVLKNLSAAPGFVDRLAPEHVELYVRSPAPFAKAIKAAGAIFLGSDTPEAVGDYIAGSNHVLPTGGAARFGSPLGVDDFLRKTSFVEFSPKALRALGPSIVRLAQAEGLPAHAGSVAVRLVGRLRKAPPKKSKGKKSR